MYTVRAERQKRFIKAWFNHKHLGSMVHLRASYRINRIHFTITFAVIGSVWFLSFFTGYCFSPTVYLVTFLTRKQVWHKAGLDFYILGYISSVLTQKLGFKEGPSSSCTLVSPMCMIGMPFFHNFIRIRSIFGRTAKSWICTRFIFSSLSFAQQNPKC